jgi:hypothetical protein
MGSIGRREFVAIPCCDANRPSVIDYRTMFFFGCADCHF